jgi:hypothetical protein
MFKRTIICLVLALMAYWFNGCGIKPQVDYYVNPLAISDEQKVDEKAGIVTYEDDNVLVKVSAVDSFDLVKVTSEPYINPYIYISDWGKAKPRYTVFNVTVKNKSDLDLTIQPDGAVLMDDQGEQYEVITSEEMRERYSFPQRVEREVVYPPPSGFYRPSWYYRNNLSYMPRPWYYHYDLYRGSSTRYVREVYDIGYLRRSIFNGTMLNKIKLYPGGKREGFLVFPMLEPEAVELKLILPAFISYEEKLEFHFKRMPAPKD